MTDLIDQCSEVALALEQMFDTEMKRYANSKHIHQFEGWTDYFWTSKKVRKAHLKTIVPAGENRKQWLLHMNIFPEKDDLFKFLPKAESVLIASILGFGFTYTDDLGAAQGGMIKDKEIGFKPLTDREIKTIQCSQVHDIVSIRTNTSYTTFIKNLENCPEIKFNLEKLKKRLKKM